MIMLTCSSFHFLIGSGSSRGGSCNLAGEMVAGREEEDDSAAIAERDPAGKQGAKLHELNIDLIVL